MSLYNISASSSKNEACIIDGYRSPFIKAGTLLKEEHPVELGQQVFRELMCRSSVTSADIQEVVIGNVGNLPDAANISRVIALRAGLPESISAYTVHRNCASGLQAVTSGADKIQLGIVDTLLAGGVESMSSYPLLFSKQFVSVLDGWMRARNTTQKLKALLKMRLRYLKPRFSILEGLTDPFVGLSMGQTAEVLSKEFGISRKDQDAFSLESHLKAVASRESGRLGKEIVPLVTSHHFVEEDNGPRHNQTIEKLSKLRPYFDRRYGSVTVGNACPITDGAVALLMMSSKKAQEFGYKPQFFVRSYAYAGCSPSRMGLGPVFSTVLALQKAGLKLKDMDLIEINEAFAAQVLACTQAFSSRKFAKEFLSSEEPVGDVDFSKLNVNGGAIALGHPVGATGARLVLTMMREMEERNVRYGLVTLCIGGGQGGALILERRIH